MCSDCCSSFSIRRPIIIEGLQIMQSILLSSFHKLTQKNPPSIILNCLFLSMPWVMLNKLMTTTLYVVKIHYKWRASQGYYKLPYTLQCYLDCFFFVLAQICWIFLHVAFNSSRKRCPDVNLLLCASFCDKTEILPLANHWVLLLMIHIKAKRFMEQQSVFL